MAQTVRTDASWTHLGLSSSMSKGMACDGVSTSWICDLVTKGRKKVTRLTPDRIQKNCTY